MFCPNCGANLGGDPVTQETPTAQESFYQTEPQTEPQAEPVYAEPSYTAPEAAPYAAPEAAPAPKKKSGLIIAIAAVLIVAIAAVVCFATGVFENPAATLAKATAKTFSEYNALAEKSKLKALNAIIPSDTLSAEASVGIRSLSFEDSLSGLGLTISASSDVENEKINLGLTPFYGSADIATVGIAAADHRIFIGSPELLDGKYAGLDTLTVGQDLYTQLGVDGFTSVSFNLFDIAKDIKSKMYTSEMVKEELTPSVEALAAALVIEKVGKETVEINGTDTAVVTYSVVAPEEELREVFDVYKDIVKAMSNIVDPIELLKDMGFPEYLVDEYLGYYDFDSSDEIDEIFDMIDDLIKENEGMTLNCYVAGGYLRGFETKGEMDDYEYRFKLELGTDTMITQSILATIELDDGGYESVVTIESTGDHMAATTLFLDNTIITIEDDGEATEVATFDTEYDTKTGDLVFKAVLMDGDYELVLDGNLTGTENSLTFTDGVLELFEYEESAIELSLDLNCSTEYQEFIDVDTEDYYDFTVMTIDDWYLVAYDVYEDVMTLAQGLDSDLQELLSMLF